MREKEAYTTKAAAIRTGTASQATVGETVALTLVVSVAFSYVAIGAWSLLVFFSSISSYGVTGVISGFLHAVTGQ